MNETTAVIKGPMVFVVFNPLNCSFFLFFGFFFATLPKYAEVRGTSQPGTELTCPVLKAQSLNH